MPKKKRKKKTKQQQFKKKCDALITEYFSGKPGYCGKPCIICGNPGFGHHLIPRSHSLYRHDWKNNIVPVCSKHHVFSNKIAAHSTNALAVQEFVKWVKKNYPTKYRFWLTHQHDTGYNIDYEVRYKKLLKEIENV